MKTKTVMIAISDGKVELPVKQDMGDGVLIHREIEGKAWVVTHAGSGFAYSAFDTLRQARFAGKVISQWSLDLGLAYLTDKNEVIETFKRVKRDGKTESLNVVRQFLRDVRCDRPLSDAETTRAMSLLPY